KVWWQVRKVAQTLRTKEPNDVRKSKSRTSYQPSHRSPRQQAPVLTVRSWRSGPGRQDRRSIGVELTRVISTDLRVIFDIARIMRRPGDANAPDCPQHEAVGSDP